MPLWERDVVEIILVFLDSKTLLNVQLVNRRFYLEFVPLIMVTVKCSRGNQRAELDDMLARLPQDHQLSA